ncbi:MAG: class I SAM-dependent methyltransferase [Acidobacteria bacterium]|nr:class I SAM-dependent methyltransferase [Acidobacteriota bacterium]
MNLALVKGVRKAAWNTLHSASSALGFGIATYRQPERLEIMRAIRNLKRSCEMLLTPLEGSQLFALVRSTAKLGGAMAEVGVFRGASARLIRQADGARPLHLFDTFEGLPKPLETDVEIHVGQFEENEFFCSLEAVKQNLESCANVHFHPGLFPATGKAVENDKFSFVHADVDLYASTKSVLEFFYPRMLRGGILLTHDFATAHGPHKAFAEFFERLPEPLIELPGDQAMVVKL